MRRVAVVGSGQTKHGRRDDVSYPELVHEAVAAALEDTGLTLKDIEAIVTGSMPSPMEGVNATHLYWSDGIGAFSKPVLRVATCGSTGMSVAHSAFYHVASGLFDVVLALGAEKMYEGDPQGTMNTVAEPFFQRVFIGGAPTVFALQCNAYIHRYGIPEERIREAAARISVAHHNNALDNPYAHIKVKITVDDVLKSRIISYPLRLLDTCPSSDGACAVIMASEEAARKIAKTPAWIKDVGYCGDEHWFGDADKVRWESAIFAAQRAYKMAKIFDPARELDYAEIYNPFTFQELLYYECFGFCGEGEACSLVERGVIFKEGNLPCDLSGGVLATNPIGASGLIRVAESALQIMGKAGAHQAPRAINTALAHAMGGVDQFNGIMILGREP
ncbi:MAG TPA: thiolase family protein [Dehalococcoidia bacterium]|nr:thiolase family protein [Dehalococcoidia bacterium]